jgi:hypothetical protein
MQGGIFISYRRDDSSFWARDIYTALARTFAPRQVFRDIDEIEPGLDFARAIDTRVSECSVCLPIIGPRWLEARDAAGERRLEDPNDFVRLELESALNGHKRMTIVLVDGAALPPIESLPPSLRSLLQSPTFPLSSAHKERGFAKLVLQMKGECRRVGAAQWPARALGRLVAGAVGGTAIAFLLGMMVGGVAGMAFDTMLNLNDVILKYMQPVIVGVLTVIWWRRIVINRITFNAAWYVDLGLASSLTGELFFSFLAYSCSCLCCRRPDSCLIVDRLRLISAVALMVS